KMRVIFGGLTLLIIFAGIYANAIVGGPSEITDDDVYSSDFAPVISAIEVRLKNDIISQFQTDQHVYLLRVISGTKQVVAGVNYNLKIMMCESTCNEKESYLQDCFY
ncbi:cystatin domain-containing protein, partial [Salmonella sp. s54836]|uniref:cystatin domain-containing protein n=1 Tax=Salmonella sp. s54836 TaxID=3159673 RepID=UPI003980F49B